jgi:hypothetical protein
MLVASMPDTERKQREQIERMKEAIRVAERNIKEMREVVAKLEKTTRASKDKRRS